MDGGHEARRLTAQLEEWAAAQLGSGARVSGLRGLGGHAGLGFAFDAHGPDGRIHPLVIRLAPPGVTRRGNTDVLHQVPLLNAMAGAGLAVAPVVWSGEAHEVFGTDAMIQVRVDGGPITMFGPEPASAEVVEANRPFLRRAAEELAVIHAFDWRGRLPDWEEPLSPADTVTTWARLLSRALDDNWRHDGERLAAALLESAPVDVEPALLHGDYQTNNILFRPADGTVAAVVDWEIAGIGPSELDVAWLAMMADASCWHDELAARLRVRAEPDEIVQWYVTARGAELRYLPWHFAMACLRYGAISVYNVRLHHTGRRVDEFNASMANTIPVLFARGVEALRRDSIAPPSS